MAEKLYVSWGSIKDGAYMCEGRHIWAGGARLELKNSQWWLIQRTGNYQAWAYTSRLAEPTEVELWTAFVQEYDSHIGTQVHSGN